MARISAYSAVTTLQDTDQFIVARSSTSENFSMTVSALRQKGFINTDLGTQSYILGLDSAGKVIKFASASLGNVYQNTVLVDGATVNWDISNKTVSTALLDTTRTALTLNITNLNEGTHHTLFVRKQSSSVLTITTGGQIYKVGSTSTGNTITLNGVAYTLFKIDFNKVAGSVGTTVNVESVIEDGNKGDITVANQNTWTINNNAVTDAKILSVSWSKVTGAPLFELQSNKGIAYGYASLDGSGKVPASQLPSFVDDVVEYSTLSAFPATGDAGVIYVALDTNRIYRWSGSTYIEISANLGTVTSVGLSVPTGLTVTGSPVTTSGTLAIGLASGYSIPTTASQANWDSAYTFSSAFPSQTGNSGKFLTTNGTTLSWGVAVTTPAGSNTQVQFNNSGAFGADSNLTWNNTFKQLNVSSTTSGGQALAVSSSASTNPYGATVGFSTSPSNRVSYFLLNFDSSATKSALWSDGGAHFTGDVYIGSTTGSYSQAGRGLLEVNGTGDGMVAVKYNGVGQGYILGNGSFIVGSTNVNLTIQATGANNIKMFTNSSERLRITSVGMMGFDVVPDTNWNTSYVKGIQIGSAGYYSIAAQNYSSSYGSLLWNAYGSGDETFAYLKSSAQATRFAQQYDFKWQMAGTGTAGSAITWTTAMALSSAGTLTINALAGTGDRLIAANSSGALSSITLTTTGSGAATLSGGVLNIPNNSGGTTLNGTGYVKMSGTTVSYVSTIPNADLTNSSITVQGTSVSLGGSVNVINGTGFVKASGTTISYDNSTYLTANQSIIWTASTDVSGSASGTTSISPSLTVVGLRGVALPTLGATAGLLKYTGTGTNTWVFDTTSYLTTNQSISISGDASGSGTTSITLTLATVNSNIGTFNNVTVNAKGLVTAASNVSYLTANQTISFSPTGDVSSTGGSGSTSLTPAITVTGLRGVSLPTLGVSAGLLKYTGTVTNTWVFDTTAYLTTNQTISISGDASGSGTTSITLTLATVNSNIGTFNNVTVNAKGLVTAASNVSYLTANQSISFSPTGDVSSTGGSGSTSLTPAITVTGLRGVALPTLGATAGLLKYTGTGTNTWVFDTSTYLTANQSISLTGDVTGTGTTSITTTIASAAVTLAKMANLAANSIIGNNTGVAATPIALTGTQVTALLDTFTSTLKGLAPASGGGTTNFLRADGTWATPAGGSGTVTTVSVVTANGISGTVATATTTPAITLTLGAITPTTVNGLAFTAAATGFTIAGGTTSKTLTVSNTLTLAGTDGSTLNIGGGGTLGTAAFTASTAYEPSITTLAISKGGTGSGTAPTAFGVIYAASTTAYASTSSNVTTTKQFLSQTGNGTASAAPVWGALASGDIPNNSANTSGSAGSVSGTNVITNANLRQSAARSVIGNATNATANVADISTTTADQVLISTATTLTWGTVTTAAITNSAVTYAKIQNVAANTFLANATASAAAVQEIATTRIPLFASAITGTPSATTYLRGDGSWSTISGGTGTVTSVSVTTANGVSGTVATSTTTPAITLTLGAITPTTVNGLTFTAAATGFTIAGGTTSKTLTVSNTLTFSGTDTSTLNIGSGGTLGSAAFTASTAYEPAITTLTAPKGGTGQGTYAIGDTLYASATNALSRLTVGAANTLLVSTGTIPSWSFIDMSSMPSQDLKKSVLVATTPNDSFVILSGAVTSISTGIVVDGVNPSVNSRILIKNAPTSTGVGTSQNSSNPANGIYVVTAVTTTIAVSRATDADISSDLRSAIVSVDAGTINGGKTFKTNFKTTDTINTSSVSWYEVGSSPSGLTTNTTTPITLVPASSQFQIHTAGTATYILPSTGVSRGSVYEIVNNTPATTTLTVQYSSGNTLTYISSNSSAQFVALQDSPSSFNHWYVKHKGYINQVLSQGSPIALSATAANIATWSIPANTLLNVYKRLRFRLIYRIQNTSTTTATAAVNLAIRATYGSSNLSGAYVLIPAIPASSVNNSLEVTLEIIATTTTSVYSFIKVGGYIATTTASTASPTVVYQINATNNIDGVSQALTATGLTVASAQNININANLSAAATISVLQQLFDIESI